MGLSSVTLREPFLFRKYLLVIISFCSVSCNWSAQNGLSILSLQLLEPFITGEGTVGGTVQIALSSSVASCDSFDPFAVASFASFDAQEFESVKS